MYDNISSDEILDVGLIVAIVSYVSESYYQHEKNLNQLVIRLPRIKHKSLVVVTILS